MYTVTKIIPRSKNCIAELRVVNQSEANEAKGRMHNLTIGVFLSHEMFRGIILISQPHGFPVIGYIGECQTIVLVMVDSRSGGIVESLI